MQDIFDDFNDLYENLDIPPTTSYTKNFSDIQDIPDITVNNSASLDDLLIDLAPPREDKPHNYTPPISSSQNRTSPSSAASKSKSTKLDKPSNVDGNAGTPAASPTPSKDVSANVSTNARNKRLKELSGSINKISTPPLDYPYSMKEVSNKQDRDLIAMAAEYDTFSLSAVSDYQVASPTAAEFIAQYYRLTNHMIAKVTLNQLVTEDIELMNMWFDGTKQKSLNISGNTTYTYDDVYRYCVEDSVINLLRGKYQSKKIDFSTMQVHQIMGAGDGISSAKQAAYYLERMASSSFSSTLGLLNFRKKMVKTREWFEDTLQGDGAIKSQIRTLIQDAVIRTSQEQAAKYKGNNDIFVVSGHRCILFARKLLARHSNIQLADNHLQLSALIFLMSGIQEDKPLLGNIGYAILKEGMTQSPSLVDSLIDMSYESHRYCYSISDLSRF